MYVCMYGSSQLSNRHYAIFAGTVPIVNNKVIHLLRVLISLAHMRLHSQLTFQTLVYLYTLKKKEEKKKKIRRRVFYNPILNMIFHNLKKNYMINRAKISSTFLEFEKLN